MSRRLRPDVGRVHRSSAALDDRGVERVLDVWRGVPGPEQTLGVRLVLGEEEGAIAFDGEPEVAHQRMRSDQDPVGRRVFTGGD